MWIHNLFTMITLSQCLESGSWSIFRFSSAYWRWSHICSRVSKWWTHTEPTHFIMNSCVSIRFNNIFDRFKRFANVLADKCRSSSMMEAIVLVLISVTEALGLPHHGAWWSDFWPALNCLSWLYTYHFSRFDMFVHYFMRLRINHYTLLTISPILFIFDSARNVMRNLPYRPFWRFVKIPIAWREWWNAR